jgi:serine/threonine protein kinase
MNCLEIKKEDYSTYFENLKSLAQPSFAIIYEGNYKNTNQSKAIKIYEKERVKAFLKGKLKRIPTEKDLQIYYDAFKNEATNMNILQGINKENQNAVILDNCFDTDKQFAIVMEKCDNNLFNHLADRNEPFNSEEIYEILTQLNNSFKIMDDKKILHRAIKPQNILLKYQNDEKTKFIVKLKITDDSCTSSNSHKFLDSNFGRNYRIYAPEVLNEKDFTEESDLWSLGILIYTLCFRVFPFDGNSRETVLSNITEDAIKNLKKCENIDLNNLIRELLIIEPNKRICWDEYFIHPFFKKKMDFREFYDQSDFLDFSTYANIYKGRVKDKNGKEKAIKIMDKTLIKSQLQEKYAFDKKKIDEELKKIIKGFYNEVNHMEILQGLNNENQNTVIFDEYFNTNKEFVIIMELCDDNLLDYFLREKERKHKLNPEEIHDIISQLNNSFRIMVKNKILHRALRPKNILMKYLNKEKTKFIVKLKLTDDSGILNSSNNLISQDKINDDNLRFYAPEVLEKGIYTEKSDLFSLGVLIYNLYFDEYPFEGQNKEEILNKIAKGIIKKTKNPEFDDLLDKLLNGNEKKEYLGKIILNIYFSELIRIIKNIIK